MRTGLWLHQVVTTDGTDDQCSFWFHHDIHVFPQGIHLQTHTHTRRVDDHYEYIGVYVDDLIVAAANPQQIFETLKETYSLRLKGVEPLRYHLGCNFFRDPDGTLCQSARTNYGNTQSVILLESCVKMSSI